MQVSSAGFRPVLVPILLGAVLLVASCSSAPKQPERIVEIQNRAGQRAEFGNAYFSRAEYQMALQFFNLALQDNISVDNLSGIAKSYNSIGRVYMVTGFLTEAAENFRLALQFAESAQDNEQRMQCYVNIAELAMRTADSRRAMEFLKRAHNLISGRPIPVHAIVYHNLGTLHARDGNFGEATDFIQRAIRINRAESMWIELGSNYFVLSSIHLRKNELDAAYQAAQTALDWDKRAEHSPGIAEDLRALGSIAERQERTADAHAYYLRALRVFLTLNQLDPTLDLLQRLERVSAALGRTTEAEGFAAQRARLSQAASSVRQNR